MANGGKQTEAALEAGYAAESAQTSATRLVRLPNVQKEIMRATLQRIGLQAVPALHTLERLRDSAKSDYVRLEAAKDLLDRAGFRPPERVEGRLDASLTVELVLAHGGDGEGGSKRAVTGTGDVPHTGKTGQKLDLDPDQWSLEGDFQDSAGIAPEAVDFGEDSGPDS